MRQPRNPPRAGGVAHAATRRKLVRAVAVAALLLGAVPAAAQDPPPTTPTTSTTTTTTTSTTTTSTTTTTTAAPSATTTTTPDESGSTTTTLPSDTTSTTLPATDPDPDASTIVPEASTELSQEEVDFLLALQREYDELVADESATLAEYTIRLARVEELDTELALADVEIATTERELELAIGRILRLGRSQRANLTALRRTEVELELARERLRRQAVDAFVMGSSTSDRAWEALLDAENAGDAGIVNVYAEVVLDRQSNTIATVAELESELANASAAIAASQDEADEVRREVEQLERDLQASRDGLQGERDQVEAERVELDAALTAIRNTKADYDQRLQTMAIESDNITSVLNRAQQGQERPRSFPLLRGPLEPTVVTSNFGPRLHPIFNTLRRHNGLDMTGGMGDPIRAVDDGIVVMAELRNGFGNTIVIDHGGRIASLYAHQSSFEVGVGDVVQRGELIGRVGSTGWSTGPHLHLEIRQDGIAIDPAGYLVRDEPIDCAVLVDSDHAIDQTLLAGRPDCQ